MFQLLQLWLVCCLSYKCYVSDEEKLREEMKDLINDEEEEDDDDKEDSDDEIVRKRKKHHGKNLFE